jgi:hypothetical protein
MRRLMTASAFALAVAVAAPAGAGPIVFVSGPSPVAIVSGTLTASGPEVSRGLFLLETANGFPSWPGGLTQAGFLCASCPAGIDSAAALLNLSLPVLNSPARQPGRLPSQVSPVTLPMGPSLTLPLLVLGFDLSGQEARLLFAFSLLGTGPVTVQVPGGTFQFTPFDTGGSNAVPEPATVMLLSSGLAGVFLARRRLKRKA